MSIEQLSSAEPDRWRLDMAPKGKYEAALSPSEAIREEDRARIQEIADRYGLTISEAAVNYVESRAVLEDPNVRRSIRQMEAGQLETIDLDAETYLGGAITVIRRSDDVLAHVTGNPAMWDCGRTADEAIGALVRTWPEEIAKSLEHTSDI